MSYLQAQGFTNVQAGTQLVSADGTAAQAANRRTPRWTRSPSPARALRQYEAGAGAGEAGRGGERGARTLQRGEDGGDAGHSTQGRGGADGQCAPGFDAATVQTSTTRRHADRIDDDRRRDGRRRRVEVVSDLAFAEDLQGLPQVPVNVVNVGDPSTDTAGVDEWNLDTQSSTGWRKPCSSSTFTRRRHFGLGHRERVQQVGVAERRAARQLVVR